MQLYRYGAQHSTLVIVGVTSLYGLIGDLEPSSGPAPVAAKLNPDLIRIAEKPGAPEQAVIVAAKLAHRICHRSRVEYGDIVTITS